MVHCGDTSHGAEYQREAVCEKSQNEAAPLAYMDQLGDSIHRICGVSEAQAGSSMQNSAAPMPFAMYKEAESAALEEWNRVTRDVEEAIRVDSSASASSGSGVPGDRALSPPSIISIRTQIRQLQAELNSARGRESNAVPIETSSRKRAADKEWHSVTESVTEHSVTESVTEQARAATEAEEAAAEEEDARATVDAEAEWEAYLGDIARRAEAKAAAPTRDEAPEASTRESSENPWRVLGVRRHDKADVVRNAFKNLARHLHPDKNTSADATVQMQRVIQAYRSIQHGLA